jgi:hypothetical protein
VKPSKPFRSPTTPAADDVRAAYDGRPVLRYEGDYWAIVFAGTVCRLRDSAGLRQLAHLIGRPGERIPATELVASTIHRRDRSDRLGTEAARVRVAQTIRRALARIAEHHPELNEHLRATIKTGARCAYLPDPRLQRPRSPTRHNVTSDVTPIRRGNE